MYLCVKVTKKNKNIQQHTIFQGVSFLGFLQSLISFRIFLPSHCHLSGSFCRLLLSFWSFCRLFSIILRLFAIFPADVSLLFRVFLPFSGSFCCLFGSFATFIISFQIFFFLPLCIFPGLFADLSPSSWIFLPSFCSLINIVSGLFAISWVF